MTCKHKFEKTNLVIRTPSPEAFYKAHKNKDIKAFLDGNATKKKVRECVKCGTLKA